MSNDHLIQADEMDAYDFGDQPAPADFDPNTKGYLDAPVGVHTMELTTFAIKPDHEFRDDGQSYYLTQLRPNFKIPDGQPHASGTVMDFLPMPTKGPNGPAPMATRLANRWGQFLKALGFIIPPGMLVPPGFQLNTIIGRRCEIAIVKQVDKDKMPKIKSDGTPQLGVKFFGYAPCGSANASPAAPTAPVATAQATPPPTQAPEFDL